MRVITNWIAQRSGATMTVHGEIEGKPVRLSNVIKIMGGQPHPVALTQDGDQYALSSGTAP